MKPVRTRFAPSPTGYLHVGGARTALFNFLYVKAKKGVYVLRIEDTDQVRSDEESCRLMIESMKWLGLEWDEGYEKGGSHGPYRQSERLDIYHEHIQQLLEEKKAYRCFCTPEELENKKKRMESMGLPSVYDGKCRSLSEAEAKQKIEAKENFTVRFQTDSPGEIVVPGEVVVKDAIQGSVRFDPSLIGDFIILKSDNYPSYNFAVVIDDHLMEISHVIRGVGHLSNTPRQVLIYDAFGWEQPVWAHVSEIVGSDHKKLSKRHGAVSVTSFRDMGYPREAFINYMSLLGWSPQDGNEYMTLERIIEQFDIQRCSKSPAMFDVFDLSLMGNLRNQDLNELNPNELQAYLTPKSKLNWISNQTIRDKPEANFLEEVMPFIEVNPDILENSSESSSKDPNRAHRMKETLLALRVYLDNYAQMNQHISDFLIRDASIFDKLDDEAMAILSREFVPGLLANLKEKINDLEPFDEMTIKKCIKEVGEISNIKGKDLFMSIRVAVTAKTHGLELPAYIKLLGKEMVLSRLELLPTLRKAQ